MNRKRRTQSSSHVQPCDSFGAARASGRLPVRSGLCGDRDELIHFGPDVSQIVFDITILACWPVFADRLEASGLMLLEMATSVGTGQLQLDPEPIRVFALRYPNGVLCYSEGRVTHVSPDIFLGAIIDPDTVAIC